MAININTGFTIGSESPIDDRLTLTINEMKNVKDTSMPQVYMCICKDDGQLYIYNKSNIYNDSTGKFRLSVSESGGAGTAEEVSYSNDSYPDLNSVDSALDNILAKIYYIEPKITSFTMTPSTTEYEIGSKVSSLSFSWSVNKEIVSQSLTDCVIELGDRSATYNTEISSNKTFTLTVSDGEKFTTSSKSIKFYNKAYWGSASQQDTYDSSFILSLSGNKFSSSKNGTYSMNIEEGQYGYLALPTSFGNVGSCWIGGFEVTLDNCGDISFTNASGHTSSYTIYKTNKSGLGSINMEVK